MRLSTVRLLSTKQAPTLIQRLKLATPLYIRPLVAHSGDLLYRGFADLNKWYTRVLGLDEVKVFQDRVVDLQERLLDTQQKRREVGRKLAEVRHKSNHLQDEIHKVKRQDNLTRFLDLMKDETELLRLEQEITHTFQEHDATERELFTAFTNAIRDSHEKQRAQLEYTKYFGIILSMAGSLLAFAYSTLKKNDLKRFIEERLNQNLVVPIVSPPPPPVNSIDREVEQLRDQINRLNSCENFEYLLRQEYERKYTMVLYGLGAFLIICCLVKSIS